MFWERWIPQKFLLGSAVCGLEAQITESGYLFHYTLITYKSNKLEVGEYGTDNELATVIGLVKKKKIPVLLIVSGKGLIIKNLDFLPEDHSNLNAFIEKSFPAVSAADFFIQLHPAKNNKALACLLRKSQLNDLLDLVLKQRLTLASVLLGPGCVSDAGILIQQLPVINTACYKLAIDSESIETVTVSHNSTEQNVSAEVPGLSFKPAATLGFAAGFNYFTGRSNQRSNDSTLDAYQTAYLENNKLKILGGTLLCVLFICCLANFLAFSHYFGSNNSLETRLNLYQEKYDQVNELLDAYEKKKALIEKTGIMDKNTISKYTDKIAGSVPKEISLTEWTINPVQKSNEADSLVRFFRNSVLLKGKCNKSLVVNEWVNVLKSLGFIKEVNLEKFTFNTEAEGPNFEISMLVD